MYINAITILAALLSTVHPAHSTAIPDLAVNGGCAVGGKSIGGSCAVAASRGQFNACGDHKVVRHIHTWGEIIPRPNVLAITYSLNAETRIRLGKQIIYVLITTIVRDVYALLAQR